MPKYLITATAFRRSDEKSESYSPRTFSFEVNLSEPWSAKNSAPVGDLAFHECHRAFGWWPSNNPQIDSVIATSGLLPEDLHSRLVAAVLMNSDEIHDLITDILEWDDMNRAHVTPPAWSDAHGQTTGGAPAAATDDYDELI